MLSTAGVIFSSINDENISELTKVRSMGAVPFGGRYRLVDFVLSNMVNAGITTVGMLTKNNYQSLMDHLGSGKNWDLARKEGGLILLPPYSDATEKLYRNHLEALNSATAFLNKAKEDYVVLADSDAIFKCDFSKAVEFHVAKNADFTLIYHKHETSKAHSMVFEVNDDSKITSVGIAPNAKGTQNVFTNMIIARKSFLLSLIQTANSYGYKSLTYDVILPGVNTYNFYGYELTGYYKAMDSMDDYFQANMDMLDKNIRTEVFGARDVYTKINDSAPAKFAGTATVKNSLIADGCVIEGTVENCILFKGVKVGKNTVLKNCIIMSGNIIGENCNLSYVISDKDSVVRDNRTLAGCEVLPYFINKCSII